MKSSLENMNCAIEAWKLTSVLLWLVIGSVVVVPSGALVMIVDDAKRSGYIAKTGKIYDGSNLSWIGWSCLRRLSQNVDWS